MTAWTSQAKSRETAENDSCRHSHTCDKSRVASAAIVTALLQGKPLVSKKTQAQNRSKPFQNDSEVSEAENNRSSLMAAKKSNAVPLRSYASETKG